MRIMEQPTSAYATGIGDFMQLARMIAMSRDRMNDLVGASKQSGISARVQRIVEAMLKNAVTATDLTAVSLDYQTVSQSFQEALRNSGCFDRMLSDGFRRVPMRSRVTVVSFGAVGDEVAMGAPKPISSFQLLEGALPLRKASAIVVTTRELLAATASAQAMFSAELRGAAASAVDKGLFNGITTTGNGEHAGSSGSTFPQDLAAMMEQLPTGSRSRVYFIAAPDLARFLSTLTTTDGVLLYPNMGPQGGTLTPWLPGLVSDELTARSGMLIDAAQIAADAGDIVLDASRAAAIEMSDAPSDGAQNLVSLWQTDSTALRCERTFAFEILNPAAVVVGTELSPA